MRRILSTLLGIVLLLVVLEATAINDNDTSRKIQQQQQDNFNGRDDYVDTAREIDCDRFPIYCQEKNGFNLGDPYGPAVGGGEMGSSLPPVDQNVPGENETATSPASSPVGGENGRTQANVIVLRVSVGFTNANQDSHLLLARLTTRVITNLLDRYSPFSVTSSAPPEPQNRVLGSLEEEEQQQVYPLFQNNNYGEATQEQQRHQQRHQQRQLDNGNGNINNYNRIQDDVIPPRAKMFLLDTHKELVGVSGDWIAIQVSYTVFRITDQPILKFGDLNIITDICSSVLNATIASGNVLNDLQKLIHESVDPDVQALLAGGGGTRNPDDDPNDDNEVYLGVAVVGEEFSLADGTSTGNGTRGPDGEEGVDPKAVADNAAGPTYPTPLQLGDPWGTREWFGLVLFLVLVFSTSFLSYFSVWIKRRQSRQQLWGAQCLTESGVGDLLNVGWRYQEGGEQLFLQVFDKGKLGYNDDNSMLMGGAVDQTTTPTTLPSSTATTTTPNS